MKETMLFAVGSIAVVAANALLMNTVYRLVTEGLTVRRKRR